jgi:RNA polymerase sigma-70 factor (ECF subfamily)
MGMTGANGIALAQRADDTTSRSGGPMSDEEVITRVRAGDTGLFEIIVRRCNQRLYRVARAILADDDEAQDVVQAAYLQAYTHLTQFSGRSSFRTWLIRIVINEARQRARVRRLELLSNTPEPEGLAAQVFKAAPAAEHEIALRELRQVLEWAVARLSESFRTVFILREVEQLSVAETAELLDIPEQTVRTRLHRARALLRRRLSARLGAFMPDIFEFGGARCDRLVAAVMAEIALR